MIASVHVEMYDGEMFCGEFELADGSTQRVWRSEWHQEPEQIQRCNCESCLLKLFMLGDSARIALARMGRVVQVFDVDGEAS